MVKKFYEFGIPVISGMFNGSSDLLRTNSNLQFPNVDPVEAVDNLIKNKKLFDDSRTNALEFIKSHNDIETKEMWIKILLSLNNNDKEMRKPLLSLKVIKNSFLKKLIAIFSFRIRYTLNYKIRLFIDELFYK